MKNKILIFLFILIFSATPFAFADSDTDPWKEQTDSENTDTSGLTIDDSGNIVMPSDDTITITLNFPEGWYGQKIQIIYPEEIENNEGYSSDDKQETEAVLTSTIDGQGKANITVPKNSNPTLKLGSDAPVSSGNIEDSTFTITDVLKFSVLCFAIGVVGILIFDSNRISKWKKRAADGTYDSRLDDF